MAKDTSKAPKLPKGASHAQTQEYLYKLFKQGHPPAMALEMLKSAGNAGEIMRSLAATRFDRTVTHSLAPAPPFSTDAPRREDD